MALVLFDGDGILYNTEVIYARVGREVLSSYGLIYDEETFEEKFLGASMDAFKAQVRQDWLVATQTAAPEQIFTDIHARYMRDEAQQIQEIAGVRDYIERLVNSKTPYALVSNSLHVNIERKLRAVGLYDLFAGHISSVEDVNNGKPAPDIYLHAMRMEGETDPRKCIVNEDSPVGVTAGHAAGMRVLGYSGNSRNHAAYEAKLVKAGAQFTANTMAAIAMEAFELIDMIDQGPNWRNAPVRAGRKPGGFTPP